jgi:hypothetical protein
MPSAQPPVSDDHWQISGPLNHDAPALAPPPARQVAQPDQYRPPGNVAGAGTATRLNLDCVLPGSNQPTSGQLRHYLANLDPEPAAP